MNWLNPKRWIIALAKRVIAGIVQKEGDQLQAMLKQAIRDRCEQGRLDAIIDAAQARLARKIDATGPKWELLVPVRAAVKEAVLKYGDEVQAGLKREVCVHGPLAVDRVFDGAQKLLIERIAAI